MTDHCDDLASQLAIALNNIAELTRKLNRAHATQGSLTARVRALQAELAVAGSQTPSEGISEYPRYLELSRAERYVARLFASDDERDYVLANTILRHIAVMLTDIEGKRPELKRSA